MRQQRLADQIRDEVAQMLQEEVKDPRIGFASIVKVDLSGDLRVAKIHVSVLGSQEAKQETLKGLESALGFIRRELGRRLRLRHVPELRFVLDEGIAHGARIAELLREIHEEEKGSAPEAVADKPESGDETDKTGGRNS